MNAVEVRKRTSACVKLCAAAGAMATRPFFNHCDGRIAETSARTVRRSCARDVVTTVNATRENSWNYRDNSTFDDVISHTSTQRELFATWFRDRTAIAMSILTNGLSTLELDSPTRSMRFDVPSIRILVGTSAVIDRPPGPCYPVSILAETSWCGWRDLNPRHSVPKTDALSAELQPRVNFLLRAIQCDESVPRWTP